MGACVSRTDFEWVYTDEPHATRRKEIIKKHPEIKKLMGVDPHFKWIVSLMVIVSIASLWVAKDLPFWQMFLLAYCFTGVINHSLTLAIHDISHNVAFGQSRPFTNRMFGIWASLPLGVHIGSGFKKYHTDHHKFQGVHMIDTDIPTYTEALLFSTTFTKVLFLFIYPFLYTLRPMLINPKKPTLDEVIGHIVQVLFDCVIAYFLGIKMVLYMLFATAVTMGLHPMAGHFIAEHYLFQKGHETYSYYGIINKIIFNAGYHMEHHDFPYIPGSLLPEVKKIAPEYYENLPTHKSYIKVLWDFVMDPDIGPYARACRKMKVPEDSEKQRKKL